MIELNGSKIRENAELEKNHLYNVGESRVLQHEEKQDDGTKDIVQLNFQFKEDEKALYGKEWHPGFLKAKNCKAADILALVYNTSKKRVTTYLWDVKRTIGGEDVICDLVKQLQASYLHKNSMLMYLENFVESAHMGVITAVFDEERIKKAIEKKQNKEDKSGLVAPMLGGKVKKMELDEKAKITILEDFLQRRINIKNKLHPLEVHIMEPVGNDYIIELPIQL